MFNSLKCWQILKYIPVLQSQLSEDKSNGVVSPVDIVTSKQESQLKSGKDICRYCH